MSLFVTAIVLRHSGQSGVGLLLDQELADVADEHEAYVAADEQRLGVALQPSAGEREQQVDERAEERGC